MVAVGIATIFITGILNLLISTFYILSFHSEGPDGLWIMDVMDFSGPSGLPLNLTYIHLIYFFVYLAV